MNNPPFPRLRSDVEQAVVCCPENVGRLVAVLAERADEINVRGRARVPMLVLAVVHGRSTEFIKIMLESGFEPNQRDPSGRTALEATLSSDVPLVSPLDRDRRVPERQSELTRIAIWLMIHGARAVRPGVRTGSGNARCARCISQYADALACSVLRRAALSHELGECLVHCCQFVSVL
jgi:hypothetical protein